MRPMRSEIADRNKTDSILEVLQLHAQGLSEAYALLILTIYRLNFEFNAKPVTLVELADEVQRSVLSIRQANTQ